MVIMIISVITVAAVPGFTRSLRVARFEKAVGEVVVLLERARTQALASKLDSNQKIPPGGYGVFFDFTNQEVVLFVDNWNATVGKVVEVGYGDDVTIANRVMPDGIYTATSDSLLAAIEINNPEYVQITELKGTSLIGSAWDHDSSNTATVIFRPPYADTTIIGVDVIGTTNLKNFEIEFKLVTEDISRTIKFNRVTTTPQVFQN